MEDFNSKIEKELSRTIGIGSWGIRNYFNKPINLGMAMPKLISERKIIESFFKKVAELAQNALINNYDEIIQILFSESPSGLDIDYHKKLPVCCWNSPVIYRTDQSLSGKIYEIQAPGSGWGDLYLYAICLEKMGYKIPQMYYSFPRLYADNLVSITGKATPHVFHMTDAASVPYSIRYLQGITAERIKYWGTNSDVKMNDIDCLISHSVVSTTTSNYFKTYLKRASEGTMIFSTPPNLIYDEKAIYVLPFHRKTKDFFSDEMRSIFPYTSIIENGGFYDKNGEFVSIENFIKRKPSERKYYLKYGGPDTNRNWGSKTVFRLNGNDCEKLLNYAKSLSKKGEVWLIQEDVSKNVTETVSDDIDQILNDKKYIKISGYYGMDCFFGAKIMARHHFKVHGQTDTFVGLGI